MTITTRGVQRFLKYGLIGGGTFAVDLFILALLTELLALPYQISTPIGFFVGISANYALSRRFVFKYSARSLHSGYVFFIAIAMGGAIFITTSVAMLVEKAGLSYIFARVLVAVACGVGNYILNLYLNFRVSGIHDARKS